MYLANGQVVCSSSKATRVAADRAAGAALREGFDLPADMAAVSFTSLQALQYLASAGTLAGVHSISTPPKLQPGLIWARYDQGYFNDNIDWFSGLTPSATGRTEGWTSINHTPGDTAAGQLPTSKTTEFSFTISGYFVPQTSGSHSFVLASDDAAYFWMGSDATKAPTTSNTSINNGGLHGLVPIKTDVTLTAGQVYPILIMYGQNFGEFALQFVYSTPGAPMTATGKGFFFSDLPAIVGPGPGARRGLSWFRYDQGYFKDQPSAFRGLTASATGTTSGWMDLNTIPGAMTAGFLPIARTNKFSFIVTGMFVPLKDGVHQLFLRSDDAAYMWLGPIAMGDPASLSPSSSTINLSGEHPNNSAGVNVDMLAGNAYPLLIMYGQNEGAFNLNFLFAGPDIPVSSDGSAHFFTLAPDQIVGPQGATPGLAWSRFDQGYFNDQPSWFEGVSPSATGSTNGWLDLARDPIQRWAGHLPIAQTSAFSFLVWGAFFARTTGTHKLTLSSDDASYLWFGQAALIDPWDLPTSSAAINLRGLHGNFASSVSVSLVAGLAYPLLIMFGQNEGGFNMQFSFTLPGSNSASTDGTGFFFTSAPGTLWPPTSVAKNDTIVDGGDNGASTGSSRGPAVTFTLKDMATGNLVRYDAGINTVREDGGRPVVNWRIFKDGSVYNDDQGAVGLCDDATDRCMRHAGLLIWEYPFVAKSFDFAWVFRKTGTDNVYTLFNYHGGPNNPHSLNFNGSQLLISADAPPRQWQVIGSDTALAMVRNIAR